MAHTRLAGRICPRCGGSAFLERDHTGRYWNCLQCGYDAPVPVRKPRTTGDSRPYAVYSP